MAGMWTELREREGRRMGGIVGEAERKHTHMSSAAENVEEWCHKVQLSERASHVCVSVCVCASV